MTGTPGTGKTEACRALAAMGHDVRSVRALAEERGAISALNGGECEVDTEALSDAVSDLRRRRAKVVVEGHLSHHLRPSTCIVLRCSPTVLERRLRVRKYPKSKVRENLEAEAIDLILVEALKACPRTFEIDATKKGPERVAKDVEAILGGRTRGFKPGKVDWSGEVLGWF